MSLLGEIATQIVGEVIGGIFGSKKSRRPFPEGDTKASFGSASAFFGSLGLIFGLLAVPIAVLEGPTPGMSLGAILSVAGLGLTVSYLGLHCGRKTPSVTRQRLGMAKYGVVVSKAGLALAVVALVASAVRIFL